MSFGRTKAPTGVGLGLRWSFLNDVLEGGADGRVRFFEIAPENYVLRGDWIRDALDRVADRFPILSHGLSLSLGGTDPLDARLLGDLRELLVGLKAQWHSDHLSFTSDEGVQFHELLPIPWTKPSAERTTDRIRRAQDALGLPMAAENVTYYVHAGQQELAETDFIAEVLDKSDGGLVLDLNNVHVNAHNHGFDPWHWLKQIPLERVVQIHVAGPEAWEEDVLVDTHAAHVPDRVKAMLSWTLERTGPVPVLLERDHAIPKLPDLLQEVAELQTIYDAALARRGSHAA